MPDDARQIAKVTNQDLQALPFDQALEVWSPNIATALPDHIPLDRFRRVVITAVNQNTKLAHADRRSLFNACAKCAHDGLYPDGREAALVPYSTKVKRKVERNGALVEQEFWVDMVQYLPMVAGIRKRMRNTGEVLAANAEVVHRNDHFRHVKGEEPRIEHEPCGLDEEKGEMIGAYAIIKLANGEVLRETMAAKDIDRIMRTFAKGYDKSGSPWQTSRDEMWRKTVLRRCSKGAPTGSELDRIFARDEERDEPRADSPLREIPPRPQPQDYLSITDTGTESEIEEQVETTVSRFQVIDDVGEVRGEYATEMEAIEELIALVGEMRSVASLEGLSENNPTLAHFPSVIEAYKDQKEALSNSAGATGQTEHPEERQSSTLNRKEDSLPSSPDESTDAAPRGEPNRPVSEIDQIESAENEPRLVYWTRLALAECRAPVETDDLWRKHEKRYLRTGMAAQKEIRDMFKQRNSELQSGQP